MHAHQILFAKVNLLLFDSVTASQDKFTQEFTTGTWADGNITSIADFHLSEIP